MVGFTSEKDAVLYGQSISYPKLERRYAKFPRDLTQCRIRLHLNKIAPHSGSDEKDQLVQDFMMLIDRLEELTDNADAESVIERAAIYSATKEIERQFKASPYSKNPSIRELAQKACYYLCAAIGYEFSEDAVDKSIEKATETLDSLRSTIADYNY